MLRGAFGTGSRGGLSPQERHARRLELAGGAADDDARSKQKREALVLQRQRSAAEARRREEELEREEIALTKIVLLRRAFKRMIVVWDHQETLRSFFEDLIAGCLTSAMGTWADAAKALATSRQRLGAALRELAGAKVRAAWNSWREVVDERLMLLRATQGLRSPGLRRALTAWVEAATEAALRIARRAAAPGQVALSRHAIYQKGSRGTGGGREVMPGHSHLCAS